MSKLTSEAIWRQGWLARACAGSAQRARAAERSLAERRANSSRPRASRPLPHRRRRRLSNFTLSLFKSPSPARRFLCRNRQPRAASRPDQQLGSRALQTLNHQSGPRRRPYVDFRTPRDIACAIVGFGSLVSVDGCEGRCAPARSGVELSGGRFVHNENLKRFRELLTQENDRANASRLSAYRRGASSPSRAA